MPWKSPSQIELHLREGDADVGAVGADAVRHHRGLLAFHPGEHRAEGHQHAHRVADEDDVDDEVLDHAGTSTLAASAANSVSASATPGALAKHGSKAFTTPAKLV